MILRYIIKVMILKIDPENIKPWYIKQVCRVLRLGGIIVYPTDTTYGLGCNIHDTRALEKIYQIKQQKRGKPFSFICSGIADIGNYAYVSNTAFKIIKRILPGPFTIILEAARNVPKILQTKQKTVGIRIPDNPIALEIVRELGHPIISTTLVSDDEKDYIDPIEIADRYGKQLDIIIDSGLISNELSTVISLVGDDIRILRHGKGADDLLIKI